MRNLRFQHTDRPKNYINLFVKSSQTFFCELRYVFKISTKLFVKTFKKLSDAVMIKVSSLRQSKGFDITKTVLSSLQLMFP